jgi:hypothetical protein
VQTPVTFHFSLLLPVILPSDDYTHNLRHFNSQPLFTHHHIHSLYPLTTRLSNNNKTNFKLPLYRLQSPQIIKMSPSMFGLFTAGLAAFAPLVAAYTTPTGSGPEGNPIALPGLNTIVPAGQDYKITW